MRHYKHRIPYVFDWNMCSGVMKRVSVLKSFPVLIYGTMHNYTLLTTNGIHIYCNNHQKYFSYSVCSICSWYTKRHDFFSFLFMLSLLLLSFFFCGIVSLPCEYFLFLYFLPSFLISFYLDHYSVPYYTKRMLFKSGETKANANVYGANVFVLLYKKNGDRLPSFWVFFANRNIHTYGRLYVDLRDMECCKVIMKSVCSHLDVCMRDHIYVILSHPHHPSCKCWQHENHADQWQSKNIKSSSTSAAAVAVAVVAIVHHVCTTQ